MSSKIYLASSWRNPDQPTLVQLLREEGHEVYDFRNPPGRTGFAWASIDPNWEKWTAAEYIAALSHPLAEAGFASDVSALEWADTCVLLLPAGRSAHLEAGWAAGSGRDLAILTQDGQEPELMAKWAGLITGSVVELLTWLRGDR
jgi:hypothetical protein